MQPADGTKRALDDARDEEPCSEGTLRSKRAPKVGEASRGLHNARGSFKEHAGLEFATVRPRPRLYLAVETIARRPLSLFLSLALIYSIVSLRLALWIVNCCSSRFSWFGENKFETPVFGLLFLTSFLDAYFFVEKSLASDGFVEAQPPRVGGSNFSPTQDLDCKIKRKNLIVTFRIKKE